MCARKSTSGWLPSGAFCYYRVASTELQLDDLSDPNVQIDKTMDTADFIIVAIDNVKTAALAGSAATALRR